MKEITPVLIRQLKIDEGLRLKPYRDTKGKLTIGIGRNLDDVGISKDEAEYLLMNDLISHTKELLSNYPWVNNLSQSRKEVLINMHFNMGEQVFRLFKKFLKACEEERWEDACREMEESLWYHQVGPRAVRLIEQLQRG